MKFSGIIVVFLVVVGMIACQKKPKPDCARGCMMCSKERGCLHCASTMLVPVKSSLETSLLSLDQKPARVKMDCDFILGSDQCYSQIQTSEGSKKCTTCQNVWAFDVDTNQCVKKEISSCLGAYVLGGQLLCNQCMYRTVPNSTSTKCLPYPNEEGQYANCQVMTLDKKTLQPRCEGCSKGFTALRGYCISTPEAFPGCMLLSDDGKSCVICQYLLGWWRMDGDSSKCTYKPRAD
jgi:hypothetical protein